MNSKKFSEAMNRLDDKYVSEAIRYQKKAKTNPKTVYKQEAMAGNARRSGHVLAYPRSIYQWGAIMTACLCLVAMAVFALPRFTGGNTHMPSTENAYGFTMEGSDVLYLPISFSQQKAFGIIDENATELTDENSYRITADDLGGVMGVVEYSQNEHIVGETVYHFIKFPSDDSICIIEVNGTYQFYVKDRLSGIDENNNSGFIIDAPVNEDAYQDANPNAPVEYGTGYTEEKQLEHEEAAEELLKDNSVPTAENSNTAVTLEYVTDLQDKVSAAMGSGELPFVSSSAIYENPYRLHVTVTSNTEADLAKLKAFDTSGCALEIEYNNSMPTLE